MGASADEVVEAACTLEEEQALDRTVITFNGVDEVVGSMHMGSGRLHTSCRDNIRSLG